MDEQQLLADNTVDPLLKAEEINKLKETQKQELKQFDMTLVNQLDQKVVA